MTFIANKTAIPIYKKLMNNELAAFIIGLICCYLIADFVAELICERINIKQIKTQEGLINDLDMRDKEVQLLLNENVGLKRELKLMKAIKTFKTTKEDKPKMIIQCNKCYNEYDVINMRKYYIQRRILQQYCLECCLKQTIRRSQSESTIKMV